MIDVLKGVGKVTLAMVQGPCVGGGCSLTTACDLRFADESAVSGITPARLGLVYLPDDVANLAQIVGVAAAKDVLFSGRLIDAAEAHQMRLINRLIPPASLCKRRWTMPATFAATRNTPSTSRNRSFASSTAKHPAIEADRRLFAEALEQADYREGVSSFKEKRPPRFNWRPAPRKRG